MTCAYSELYLENARRVLAVMLDYAVNSLNMEGDEFFRLFSVTGIAKQMANGNPKYIAGRSGIELTHEVLEEVGIPMETAPYQSIDRSPEYWLGWAIAYYQWSRALRFSELSGFLPFSDGLAMYKKYHEMDIRHFCTQVDKRRAVSSDETNLKRLRRMAGYSQRILAEKSNVPLRTIQQYEQRQKNINKAQAETVFALAQVLGCASRDLMEVSE